MPNDTETPTATQTPAPTVAPQTGATTQERDAFTDLKIVDPGEAANPSLAEEEPKAEGAEVEPTEEGQTEEEKPEGDQPPGTAETEAPLLAGKFKDAKDLEIAYSESSKEGLRLHSELEQSKAIVNQYQSTINKMRNQLEIIELEKEVGGFQELSEEQLIAMLESEDSKNRLKAQEYMVDKKLWQQRKAEMERRKSNLQAQKEEERNRLKSTINQNYSKILKDKQRYPEAEELEPIMHSMLDATNDGLAGHEWTPEALYLMAFGYRQLQVRQASSQAQKESEDKAKAKAKAAASAAGGSGPSTGNKNFKTPAKNNPDDLDDAAFNERLIKFGSRSVFG